MRSKLLITCLSVALIIYACSKSDDVNDTDPCTGVDLNITHTHTESVGASNNGTISILSPRGDTISYKLNNSAYQSSWYFTDLAPGNYTITIKNSVKGCTDTAQIVILNYGPKYAAVKQLIIGYCGPCHLNGGNSGNANFDTDAKITAAWDRIKIRAVDNLPTQMPEIPNASLTNPDKQKIVDWVNAGHMTSN